MHMQAHSTNLNTCTRLYDTLLQFFFNVGYQLLSLLPANDCTCIHIMTISFLFQKVLVLGNKRDLANALDEKQLIEKMNLSAIQDREICCYSISCKEKENIGT